MVDPLPICLLWFCCWSLQCVCVLVSYNHLSAHFGGDNKFRVQLSHNDSWSMNEQRFLRALNVIGALICAPESPNGRTQSNNMNTNTSTIAIANDNNNNRLLVRESVKVGVTVRLLMFWWVAATWSLVLSFYFDSLSIAMFIGSKMCVCARCRYLGHAKEVSSNR